MLVKKHIKKRVDKYGDPYANSTAAKKAKQQNAKEQYKTELTKAGENYDKRNNQLTNNKNKPDIIRLATEYSLNIDVANANYKKYLSNNGLASDKKYQKAKNIVDNNIKVLSNTYIIKYDEKNKVYLLENK